MMTTHITTLLHRAARLRQRFEADRAAREDEPLHLLRLRNLMLRIDERLQRLLVAPRPARLGPVPVRVHSFSRIGG